MASAINWIVDELTGSGRVLTAASMADLSTAIVSGEKAAFAKSFTD